MTGAEHYAEAERLLARAMLTVESGYEGEIAVAQVHATLALAAGWAPAVLDTTTEATS